MLVQILNRNEQFSCKIAKEHKAQNFELHQYQNEEGKKVHSPTDWTESELLQVCVNAAESGEITSMSHSVLLHVATAWRKSSYHLVIIYYMKTQLEMWASEHLHADRKILSVATEIELGSPFFSRNENTFSNIVLPAKTYQTHKFHTRYCDHLAEVYVRAAARK